MDQLIDGAPGDGVGVISTGCHRTPRPPVRRQDAVSCPAEATGHAGAIRAAVHLCVTDSEERTTMPNVNVTYEEMRNAGKQLQAGKNDIETRLSQLKSQVDQLVAGGYVTDTSSKQFQTPTRSSTRALGRPSRAWKA